MTIWFDVEDLIRFFQNAARPTGIQRLSFETYRAIWRQAGASGESGSAGAVRRATASRASIFPPLRPEFSPPPPPPPRRNAPMSP